VASADETTRVHHAARRRGRSLAARAQQRVRRIGMVMAYAESDPNGQMQVAAFREHLQKLGWTEGSNLRIDLRFGAGDPVRIRELARELMSLGPDLMVANSNLVTTILQSEVRTMPLVFVSVSDPIGSGFVTDLARPGGNVTGFANFQPSMGGKWLEMLLEIAPRSERVGLVYHPEPPNYRGGLIVAPNVVTFANSSLIVTLAERHRLPAIYPFAYYAKEGGLISYGFDAADQFRQGAVYADKILRGSKPPDLPVQHPTKFEIVINLKTAKALGLDVAWISSAARRRGDRIRACLAAIALSCRSGTSALTVSFGG